MKRILFIVLIIIVASACSASPTQVIEPGSTQRPGDLPRTEGDIPRVTVEEAKAALDSASAVFVDVRSLEAYETSHIPDALSIPLDEIENNPAGLDLDKEQWIITYCT